LIMINEAAIRSQAKIDGVTDFATGIAVFQGDTLLVVRRAADDDFLAGVWELPGGGVDPGETIEQGAIRELFEETNLTVDEIVGVFEGFDYATPKKLKVRQVNFKATARPGAIKLTEHDMYRWITMDEVSSLRTTKTMETCITRAFTSPTL
jgi:8-oxo-dGTP diphosphatase